MAQRVNPDELRDLLRLAKQLRVSATSTADHTYVDLFLRTAAALEERASLLAMGTSVPMHEDDLKVRNPINIVC